MKNKIIYIVLSVLINVIILSMVRGFLGMDIACVIAIFLYLFFTYEVFKRLSNVGVLHRFAIILMGTLIVHLPQRIINFKSQLVSLPELICELIGIILGYSFFYFGKRGKVVSLFIALLLSITIYSKYEKILDLLNYSNLFYKNTNQINVDAVPYFDTNNVEINSTLFNSEKFIILNIWATTCGPCIAEFPQIDSLYSLSVKTTNAQLYTACILQEEDKGLPFEIVHQRKCKFPVLTIPNWDVVIKEYGMDGVPVTFLINDKKIIFRGSLLDAWKELEYVSK